MLWCLGTGNIKHPYLCESFFDSVRSENEGATGKDPEVIQEGVEENAVSEDDNLPPREVPMPKQQ